jgi:O-antigen/teichoic acid export membrane protein
MAETVDVGGRHELARGAALAGLSRLGALIEIVSQPLLIWLFGLSPYGVYVSLWAGIVLISTLTDLAMTNALQRVVPQLDDGPAHAAVRLAISVAVGAAVLAALLLWFNADAIARHISAASEDRAVLPLAVGLFAWALPLWMFIEVATSAARARRAFGPEIRLRVFWEQVARVMFAVGFFPTGLGLLGLVAAHLASLALTCAMCGPLLRRYFTLSRLMKEPITGALARRMLSTGASLLPSNLSRRALIQGPALGLILMLPGGRGAEAAGLFEVARRISTVPYFVRQSFDYVLAPLSSSTASGGAVAIAPLYQFASRVIAALVLPLSALLIFGGRDVLSIYRPEVMAALPLLIILVVGRTFDALAGPAQTVIEMTGHRGLPILNSLIGLAVWLPLSLFLVPKLGGFGMAVAVACATVAVALSALIELSHKGVATFANGHFRAFAVCVAGASAMSLAGIVFRISLP